VRTVVAGLPSAARVQTERADLRLQVRGVEQLGLPGTGLWRGHGLLFSSDLPINRSETGQLPRLCIDLGPAPVARSLDQIA
jgi:hypothetical protein